MPYCTIEEAWGDSQYNSIKEQDKIEINNKVKMEQVPEIIVPENSYDYQDMYNNVQYPNVNYDKNILSIYPVQEEALQDAPRQFTPTYDRSNYDAIPNHNNNNKLLLKNQQNKNKKINLQSEIPKSTSNPNNKQKEGFMNGNEHFKSYVEHLENQNKELKNYLHILKQKMNPSPQKSNIFDLLLYIISGIFIIFILDSFVTLIKNK